MNAKYTRDEYIEIIARNAYEAFYGSLAVEYVPWDDLSLKDDAKTIDAWKVAALAAVNTPSK